MERAMRRATVSETYQRGTNRGRIASGCAVLAAGSLVGGLLPVLDQPWLTNSWDWTFPGSIVVMLLVGVLLGPPWAYVSPFLVVGAQHLVYLAALRIVSEPEIEHTANLGFYVLAEIFLILVLIVAVWIGTAIRIIVDARRGRA